MKVLVVGKGAREHALCWRLGQSDSVWGLWCTGNNPGIAKLAQPVAVDPTDIEGLAEFAVQEKIDLTVVGPEDPLAAGIVDRFCERGLTIFGPTRAAAQLETSKSFAKQIMAEAGIPTARFAVFDDAQAARAYVRHHHGPLVVKADGLALGKGVAVCEDTAGALEAIDNAMERRTFGAAGARIVIEERLKGEELSFFALCDGMHAVALGCAQDHKRIFDGDRGPNTGGMGAYSPVPQFDAALEKRIMDEVVTPTLELMAKRGTPFRGALFVGLMIDNGRLNVLEYNVRFGDPECEALMMRFEGDLAAALLAAATSQLEPGLVRLRPSSAVAIVLASAGYPGAYTKGRTIEGLEVIEGPQPSPLKVSWAADRIRIKVFHAATAIQEGRIVTKGGRVLVVSALANNLERAVKAAYQAADLIEFEGKQMRRDIAARAISSIGS